MEIQELVAKVTGLLQPYWPMLAAGAADVIKEKLPEAVGKLWETIKNKAGQKPAAEEALVDASTNPEDEDLQAAFRVQLKKLLENDEAFLKELRQLVEVISKAAPGTSASLVGDGTIVQGDENVASGSRGVSIRGEVKDSIINTGDNSKITKK